MAERVKLSESTTSRSKALTDYQLGQSKFLGKKPRERAPRSRAINLKMKFSLNLKAHLTYPYLFKFKNICLINSEADGQDLSKLRTISLNLSFQFQ